MSGARAAARLIHLNGPSGVGKSTLAALVAQSLPGALLCDIDRLRTHITGWATDPAAAARIRTASLAMTTAYLATGHDVVVAQLVLRADQLGRFRAAAADAGAVYVGVVVLADAAVLSERLAARARTDDGPWSRHVTAQLADPGPVSPRAGATLPPSQEQSPGQPATARALAAQSRALDRLLVADPDLQRLTSTTPEATYAALLEFLEGARVG